MTSTDAWVGGALRRVTNAVKIAELHGGRSDELAEITQECVDQTVRHALSYGYSVEAVAAAAGLDTAEVELVAGGD